MTGPSDAIEPARVLRIAGRAVRVIPGASPAGATLSGELLGYPDTDDAPSLEVVVREAPLPSADGAIVNPSSHHDLPDGFLARLPGVDLRARWGSAGLQTIELALPSRGPVLSSIARWRNRQFTAPQVLIGQKFHELAMVLAIMASREVMLLHATAVALPGGAVAIGGTGGVGKTTLGVDLCLRHGAGFLADDLVWLDQAGIVQPDLAYPKIYAYNLQGDRELHDRVFAGRPRADRWQWRTKRWRGDDQVRRRMAPDRLYGRTAEATALARYLLVVRERRADMVIEPVDAATLARASVDVLRVELEAIVRHLRWHRYARGLAGLDPWLDADALFERWEAQLTERLEAVDRAVVRVPVGYPIDTYRSTMRTFVTAPGAVASRGR